MFQNTKEEEEEVEKEEEGEEEEAEEERKLVSMLQCRSFLCAQPFFFCLCYTNPDKCSVIFTLSGNVQVLTLKPSLHVQKRLSFPE